MGKGTSKIGGSTTKSEPITKGSSITQLEKYTNFDSGQKIREDFNLQNASNAQIDKIRQLFRDMMRYDSDYNGAYNISLFKISEIGDKKPDIFFDITTEPNSSSAYIRILDTKTHYAVIGRKGGLFSYSSGSTNKKSLKYFDVAYGKHDR